MESHPTNSEMADKLSRNMRVSMKRPRTELEAEELADEAWRMHQHAQHALQEMLRTRESQVVAVEWVRVYADRRCRSPLIRFTMS